MVRDLVHQKLRGTLARDAKTARAVTSYYYYYYYYAPFPRRTPPAKSSVSVLNKSLIQVSEAGA